MSHRDMPYLLALLLLVCSPCLLFPHTRWGKRLACFFGRACLALAIANQVILCGIHWDFRGAMVAPDGRGYTDGCDIDPATLALHRSGHEMQIYAFLLVALVAAFGFALRHEWRKSEQQRRDAIAAAPRQDGGIHWLD